MPMGIHIRGQEGGSLVCFLTFFGKTSIFLVAFRQISIFLPLPWKILPSPRKKSEDAHGNTIWKIKFFVLGFLRNDVTHSLCIVTRHNILNLGLVNVIHILSFLTLSRCWGHWFSDNSSKAFKVWHHYAWPLIQ